MFTARPLSMALRRRGLPAGSPPPARAATEISRITLVKILPRWASTAFLRASIDGPRPMDLLAGCLRRRGLYGRAALSFPLLLLPGRRRGHGHGSDRDRKRNNRPPVPPQRSPAATTAGMRRCLCRCGCFGAAAAGLGMDLIAIGSGITGLRSRRDDLPSLPQRAWIRIRAGQERRRPACPLAPKRRSYKGWTNRPCSRN